MNSSGFTRGKGPLVQEMSFTRAVRPNTRYDRESDSVFVQSDTHSYSMAEESVNEWITVVVELQSDTYEIVGLEIKNFRSFLEKRNLFTKTKWSISDILSYMVKIFGPEILGTEEKREAINAFLDLHEDATVELPL